MPGIVSQRTKGKSLMSVKRVGGILSVLAFGIFWSITDDQHDLMAHHLDTYEDTVHFNTTGSVIQGRKVAQTIRSILVKR
jgi:hypothetical protein